VLELRQKDAGGLLGIQANFHCLWRDCSHIVPTLKEFVEHTLKGHLADSYMGKDCDELKDIGYFKLNMELFLGSYNYFLYLK
jgi:hypothetical protein